MLDEKHQKSFACVIFVNFERNVNFLSPMSLRDPSAPKRKRSGSRYERSFVKCKIIDICTIKTMNFVEAKFKYLATFDRFGWMPYLTIQHPVHENLIWVFFSNATLEDVGEENEDYIALCS